MGPDVLVLATIILIAWLGAVFLMGTCASLLITPLVIRAAGALRLCDAPDGVRRMHAAPVPRLGGMAVYLAGSSVTLGFFFLGTVVFVPGHAIAPADLRRVASGCCAAEVDALFAEAGR